MSLEKLNIVSAIFTANQNVLSFEINNFVARGEITQIKDACLANEIEIETIGDLLFIKLNSFINPNLILFDQLYTHFEPSFTTQEFSILKTSGEYCYHSINNRELFFSANSSGSFKVICQNIFSYYKLYNYLKSNEFADHHNSANKEIVIYNSAKGIFKIKYDSVPTINCLASITTIIDDLISTATPIELNSFFKNSLIPFANGKDSISLIEIIANAKDIISITKRDYALVSKQFDFDNFRDSLYKEKEKYFNNIREIINKIFGQAIGIPISISASIFATYKVENDSLMLLLILLAFILYVIFYIKIQFVYKSDIVEFRSDFTNDFEIIKSKSGLSPNLIETERLKIERKISSSLTMINWLIGIVIGLGLLVCLYIFYEVSKSEAICLINYLIKIL